jgi:hypothetical protein
VGEGGATSETEEVVAHGSGEAATMLGGGLVSAMVTTSDVEVRVGGLCGGFIIGGGRGVQRGRWGINDGLTVRQDGEAAVAPPRPRAAGGARGEEGSQAWRRSPTGKEFRGGGRRVSRREGVDREEMLRRKEGRRVSCGEEEDSRVTPHNRGPF